jgi:HK97 gp10 family phage protein
MIAVQSKLTGDLSGALAAFEKRIQEQVAFAGVAAMARVIEAEVALNVSGVRPGMPKVKTGTLKGSIYRVYAAKRSTATRKTYHVGWNKRKAPHGHLIEFGTSRAPAYPFMRPAFDRINEAIAAGKARMAQRFDELKAAS